MTNLQKSCTDVVGAVIDLQREGLICLDGDFVPSVHYPPITQYSPLSEQELFETYTVPKDGLLDIYVHIPYCAQGCVFCHYPGLYGATDAAKDRYLTYLEKEMDLYMRRLGIDKIHARSILIGGGTPTLLTPKQLNRFLDSFCARVDLSQCTQFNYDVDPCTIIGPEGDERLRIMRDHGVDRLTIGVQSLDDGILKIMNRHHSAQESIQSIENSKRFGYIVNIEFIYGHPGETLQNWREVIEQAVTLPTDEIQLYRLKVQAYGDRQGPIKTIVEGPEKASKKEIPIPNFVETMTMKQIAIEILAENGFEENMRRVYTRDKSLYSHYAWNQCCELFDQIGLGLTAFSSLRDRFGLNTQVFADYYKMIDEGGLPLNRGYVRTEEDQLRWAIVLPLKNSRVVKSRFEEITHRKLDDVFVSKMNRLKERGLIEDLGSEIRLTTLGAFVADEVVEQFNSVPYLPFPRDAYSDGPLNPYLDNTQDDAYGLKSVVSSPTSFPKPARIDHLTIDASLDVANLTDDELIGLLTAKGEKQQHLFSAARDARAQGHGDRAYLRGVIEVSNICNKHCEYCAMRAEDKALERYRMDKDTVLTLAKYIYESSIGTIFLQSGQDPHFDSVIDEVVPEIYRQTNAEILLCVGERSKARYMQYKSMGVTSYILKFETSDPLLHQSIIHAPFSKRLQCIKDVQESGLKLGTGNIVGLPGQTLDTLVSDIRLGIELQPDFISSAPLIPNEHTPFESAPSGDLDLTLNTIALWRIALPKALIPSVSAFEKVRSGGQAQGLEAGANVMTINFTPPSYRNRYAIYATDRFIVKYDYAVKSIENAGLRLSQPAPTPVISDNMPQN